MSESAKQFVIKMSAPQNMNIGKHQNKTKLPFYYLFYFTFSTFLCSCTEYKRQRCREKWQYFCQSFSPVPSYKSNRVRRGARQGRLFWDKLSTLFSPKPQTEGFIEDVSVAGIDNNINGVQNDANDCWRLVKQCEWVTYKTVCANKPVNVCKVSKIKTFDELMM